MILCMRKDNDLMIIPDDAIEKMLANDFFKSPSTRASLLSLKKCAGRQTSTRSAKSRLQTLSMHPPSTREERIISR